MKLLQRNIEQAISATMRGSTSPFHFSILANDPASGYDVYTVALEGLVLAENRTFLQLDHLHEFDTILRTLMPGVVAALSIFRLTGEYALTVSVPAGVEV